MSRVSVEIARNAIVRPGIVPTLRNPIISLEKRRSRLASCRGAETNFLRLILLLEVRFIARDTRDASKPVVPSPIPLPTPTSWDSRVRFHFTNPPWYALTFPFRVYLPENLAQWIGQWFVPRLPSAKIRMFNPRDTETGSSETRLFYLLWRSWVC